MRLLVTGGAGFIGSHFPSLFPKLAKGYNDAESPLETYNKFLQI